VARLVVYLLGGTAAFSLILFVFTEMSFIIVPRFKVSTAKCIVLAQLIAFSIVLPTLLFTSHPWGRGVGILGFVFLLPPSFIAAFAVRALYSRLDTPLLDTKVTVVVFSVLVVSIAAWLFTSLPRPFAVFRLSPQASSSQRYSEAEVAEATGAVETYRQRGVLVECSREQRRNAVCTTDDAWRHLTKGEQIDLLKRVVRSRTVSYQSPEVDIIDAYTGVLYARSLAGSTGLEYSLR